MAKKLERCGVMEAMIMSCLSIDEVSAEQSFIRLSVKGKGEQSPVYKLTIPSMSCGHSLEQNIQALSRCGSGKYRYLYLVLIDIDRDEESKVAPLNAELLQQAFGAHYFAQAMKAVSLIRVQYGND